MPEDFDTDSFAAKILASIRKAGTRGGGDDFDDFDDDSGGGKRGYVPKDRLRREIEKRRALETQLADLGGQVETLSTAYGTQLDALKADTATEVTRITTAYREDFALHDGGLTDPLGRKTLREAWSGLPKGEQGKGPADWWGQQTAAHAAHTADPKAHPTAPTIPRALTAYLSAPTAPTAKPGPNVPAGPGAANNGFEGLDPSKGFADLMGQIKGLAPV